jgi:hypothetical protein
MRQVSSGRMKNVPRVSVIVLGLSTSGAAQRGTESSLRTLSQAIRALKVRFTTAAPTIACQKKKRR